MAGAVAPLILMIKKEILTLKTQTKRFFGINTDHPENNSKVVLKYISREIKHLFFLEGITKISAGL